jgi:phosphotransferase system IIA component
MHEHVVGTGLEMRPNPLGDGLLIAPGQDGVDEPVAPVAGEVVAAVTRRR